MWRLTDEERELREHIRSVVFEQIRPRVREMDENCDYPHDVHETLAREGLMGLALPFEFGGREATEVSWCAARSASSATRGTPTPTLSSLAPVTRARAASARSWSTARRPA
jgi:alkylation response protein AidB-like acyl-CoA dehydrogenase